MKKMVVALCAVGILFAIIALNIFFRQTDRKTTDGDRAVGDSVLTIKADVDTLAATGNRAYSLLDSTIFNDQGEEVGRLDDFIVDSQAKILAAVIALGGFMGEGVKLVAVPAALIKVDEQGHMVLPGTTTDHLLTLPEFHYAE